MDITPQVVLRAYAAGFFPMSYSRDDPDVYWVEPERRGVMPLDRFHVPKSLRKVMKRNTFEVRINTAFRDVMLGCAAPAAGREETWINRRILDLYCRLHAEGFAHSVETWSSGELVGGLYGVALEAAFFGESMFSRATNASKVALVHLVARLAAGGFQLLDAQFITEHLRQFGAEEIPRQVYRARLRRALEVSATFYPSDSALAGALARLSVHSSTQTS